MFNYVRLSDGGAAPASHEMRSEVEIIAALAGDVLPAGPVDFAALRDHDAIRAAIARVVPGYDADRAGRSTQRHAASSRSPGGVSHEPRRSRRRPARPRPR